ncbi:MAG: putative D-cysteine desulfhydrase [actinobacterium acAcidi]|nr:MAG: putative D-cysteine desulfhydrase [actinobacterium acAcidi]
MAGDPNRHIVTDSEYGQPRVRFATLPTHLERGPILAGQSRLWVKRDDLTGLGMGGNKARKLEFLCGAAVAAGANCLITVGAGQSNHCRMTAAAGAVLGLEVHLVLAGDRPAVLEGNQLLSERFGAQQHFTGAGPAEWGLLEIAREDLTDELSAQGLRPYSIPIGGSTAVGALGYIVAYQEIIDQAKALNMSPQTIVFTSSSGGTHAGLVAGRAYARAIGKVDVLPNLLAIGVAKGVIAGYPSVKELAQEALTIAGLPGVVVDDDVEVDARWLGEDYAVPTEASHAAITWAAQNGAWVLDDVYTAKGMAGLLGNASQGRWGNGDDVIFIHTGGSPEVFVRHD